MNKELLTKFNLKRKHRRSGSRDRLPKRNIEKLSEHAGMDLGNHFLAPEASGKAWSKEYFSVEDDQFREHLKKMDIPRSMEPDGIHP